MYENSELALCLNESLQKLPFRFALRMWRVIIQVKTIIPVTCHNALSIVDTLEGRDTK